MKPLESSFRRMMDLQLQRGILHYRECGCPESRKGSRSERRKEKPMEDISRRYRILKMWNLTAYVDNNLT
jgi:hypothetical protein